MCIGNPDGGDDAVGPYVADGLKNSNIMVLNCSTTPENYTSVVKRHNPNILIIIDAVDMGLKPGNIRIVPKEKIGVMTISTHGIPLSILIGYLEQYVKKIFLIGIQPETMFGNMSDSVKKSGEKLIKLLKNRDFDKIDLLN